MYFKCEKVCNIYFKYVSMYKIRGTKYANESGCFILLQYVEAVAIKENSASPSL